MGIPANDPSVRKLAANGLNGHLADLLGPRSGKGNPRPPKADPDADGSRVTLAVWIPDLVPVSEANVGGGLTAKLARKAVVKGVVGEALGRVFLSAVRFPVTVTLERVGRRLLDDDNLSHAYKAARDTTANWLGCDDGDTARVSWEYRQRVAAKGEAVGTRITITETGE